MNNDRLPRSWTPVCQLDDIVPNTGVCALVNGEQVAVFHVTNGAGDDNGDATATVYAIENFDPGSQAAVLSRGLIGSLGERVVVASPIYKHHFDLRTGECLETPAYSVDAFAARVENGQVWVAV
ncbi:nitrite reductase [NAD(P)H] small subunit [Paraburkholderia xenovorans LB400]|jgi:nitrite reductase (NADH) small subunit|uniref:Assimilatory nitrite reductase (NAD(P)H) small subunit n=1 Tax=Paraburkholderia xenovorans (strain LB400) TaxID=266265 RepID=Q13YT3_PARXL|nr:nitrite reductase small subunit NirD [Paraburkholderia xenovorans]ABE30756.1 assimilatory nitrite reductase (NAD(P)H) small subunit [Paraburkholderia xenovorans LB400]AIP31193.1 nitrite reductase [NAD(P)H] small subunit [Paraburkholderia xenovorans LB400]